ncbi:alcohol dehydrogenase protein [Rutstroemia sp. NJR-2017a BVV2]|nr:alcohol dehydrogenase protein [Rutstroemia sp. NJR-2017a BVV2]
MSSSSSSSLPPTMRALQLEVIGQPLQIKTLPTPTPVEGSIVVKVLATSVEPAYKHIFDGKLPFLHIPTPSIPGTRAVGRVAAIGPDTTSLALGQLVVLEPFVRARDDPDVQVLWGAGVFGDFPKAKKLANEVWHDGMMAEYVRAPLENCHALNEKLLLGSPADGGLGYSMGDLTYIARHVVAYGGFRGIDLKAGETVIVAPATGAYSSAAVEVASAMGARVIAVSRNLPLLQKVAAANQRVTPVQVTGNVMEDVATLKKMGPIDAFLDISPAVANGSSHIRSCLMALKNYGRASLMGLPMNDIDISYAMAVLNNLTIRGQYMYEREDVRGLIKLVESGALKLGKTAGHELVGEFSLDEWEKAIETAASNAGPGQLAVMYP